MKSVVGQHLLMGISGTSLTKEEKEFIVDANIGGIVLFARNVTGGPEQVASLCKEIQSLRHLMPDKVPLLIGIDMEGGRVARLKAPFTQWPPLNKLGALDSPTLAFHFAHAMGVELKSVGINLDFAPCVDVLTNPSNPVIGDRSLGSDPELVGRLASALVRGYIKAGVIPCAKHFPGHGNTMIDSHLDLPVEDADLQHLKTIETIPFKRAFRARLDMVMTAHIRFPNIDPQWPATLSEIFLKKIARDDLRYRGFIITDDLDMKAMTSHFDKDVIPVRALQAGADLLLYCNEPESPANAIDTIMKALAEKKLERSTLEMNHRRILEFKKDRLPACEPFEKSEILRLVGHPDHFRISQSIAAGEVPEGLLPI